MALDLLFAIRGLLSFVAFTEFTNAGRCLLPIQYYSDSAINGGVQSSGASYIQVSLQSYHFRSNFPPNHLDFTKRL